MSIPVTVPGAPAADEQAERWRQWQLGNAASGLKTATRMRLAFALVSAAALAWLGRQVLSSPVWP